MKIGILRLSLVIGLSISKVATGSTFLWSTNNPTYGLLKGSATFTFSSDPNTGDCGAATCYYLQIVLSNTSTNPANQSSQILEGIFFDLQDSNHVEVNNATGMYSALATGGTISAPGTTSTPGTTNANICGAGQATTGTSKSPLCTTVAKGWENAYSTSGFTVGGTAYSQHYGIGDAGWTLYQGSKVGNPTNGIAPLAGISSSPNASISHNYPFVNETATFILYGLTTQNVTIANVVAAYGTAPEAAVAADANTIGKPEPGTITMFLGALGAVSVHRFRRRRMPVENGRADCQRQVTGD